MPSVLVTSPIMSDRDSTTRRYSVPFLSEENDEDDEIVFFGDDADHEYSEYDYYGYEDDDVFDGDLPPGYTPSELAREVVFVKSEKDASTGDFLRETKDLQWCLENGCEEASPGVYSGAWYFTYLHGEKEGNRAWVDAKNKRLVKESDGKARTVDNESFGEMLKEKSKGNRAFSRGQYKSALDSYLKAEELLGGAVSGIYLVPNQRAELVKVLSNQAECYLRMGKYEDSVLQATSALQMDMRHEKSLLRRAKALVQGGTGDSSAKEEKSTMIQRAVEDLQLIISLNGNGVDEAKSLMNEIEDMKAEEN